MTRDMTLSALTEVVEIFRKIRLDQNYKELRSNVEAVTRSRELEDVFSGAQKIAEGKTDSVGIEKCL